MAGELKCVDAQYFTKVRGYKIIIEKNNDDFWY